MKNFIVYKSSAGSGKTFTLVREYLRLALHDERRLAFNFRRILAVTFTNKAAAEMKSRVIEALHDLSTSTETGELCKQLCEELKVPQEVLKDRAAIVLKNILHHYSDLSIGTIDSFTHKIVKTFAHDLKLPVNFNLELDTGRFYEKVIAALFASVGEDDYVSHLLKEYALNKVRDNVSWDPESQIRDFAKLLQKENSGHYIEQLKRFDSHELEQFRLQFLDFIRHYKEHLKNEGHKALELIKSAGITPEDFAGKSRGPQTFFKKCLNLDVTLEDCEKAVATAISTGQWHHKQESAGTAALKGIAAQLTQIAAGLVSFIQSNFKYYTLCELLSKQMYPLMLLKKIEELTEAQKQEERLVFISEFNQKIFDIINNEPTPFIYERLGERYQHFLLDEFQDTSSLQWQNLLPLIDSSLASGWFNLIVGDGKQSIYRWRNANVQQFADLPLVENKTNSPVVEERAQSLSRNFTGYNLQENYRSAKQIIEFNNNFFTALSSAKLTERHAGIYQNHEQNAISSELGLVTLHTGKADKETLDEQTQQLVLDQIHSALAAGYTYRDICVLGRSNQVGNKIADVLLKSDIPVVSSDSLLLVHNLEVNTLLACLRYQADRKDLLSAAAVLNYLFQRKKITEAAFHDELRALAKDTSLSTILKRAKIELDEDELSLSNLFDTCVRISRALSLTTQAYAYIRFFLDEISEFLVMNTSNLSEFFDWWDIRQKKASMVIPENTNAVRIMTIHASKGLEFPVVIIPYCNWPTYRPQDDWVEVRNDKTPLPVSVVNMVKKAQESGFEKEVIAENENQVLDNLNLLYVAFTRAAARLHIIATQSSGQNKETVADWIENYASSNLKSETPFIYQLGEASQRLVKKKRQISGEFNLNPLTFENAGSVVRIKSSFLRDGDTGDLARQQGILMHLLLSQIRVPADLSPALEKALQLGELTADEVPQLQQKVSRILKQPILAPAFQHDLDVWIEREIISPNGVVLRPDRFVKTPDGYLLIDYKTGKENYKSHSRQLQNYQEALENMGYRGIRKLLVYIDEEQVVEVN